MNDNGYKRNRFAKAGLKINVLPIPCTKVQEKTVKDWFAKINEELEELKEMVLTEYGLDDVVERYIPDNRDDIVDEACDVITVITSMLEAMSIDEGVRQEAQKYVNERNRERGRI